MVLFLYNNYIYQIAHHSSSVFNYNMPHCLIVVMAPRVVLMNKDGDIVIQQYLVDEQGDTAKVDHIDGSTSEQHTQQYVFEISIKNYLYQTLENLQIQNYFCSKPNIVEDEKKNSIQVRRSIQSYFTSVIFLFRLSVYVKRVLILI